jgi:hypothetical protein
MHAAPVFLGGALAWLVERRLGVHPGDDAGRDRVHRTGILFAAGLITGEALMGIVIAVPIVASGRADVLALPPGWQAGEWLGLVLLGAIAALLYRAAVGSRR